LKLDFKKVFDTVHLSFFFHILENMGIPPNLIQLVKLLFTNVEASIRVDTKSFPILIGVKQGYPLAPYLFLFVGETLNRAAKYQMKEGKTYVVKLPEHTCEQLINQYANEVNFMILTKERFFRRLSKLIDKYGDAFGLHIDWPKSLVFYLSLDH